MRVLPLIAGFFIAGCTMAEGQIEDLAPEPEDHSSTPTPSRDGGTPPAEDSGGTTIFDSDGAEPDTAPPPADPLATDLAIDEIAIYQGVKISLAKSGTTVAERNDVVAGRPAFLRVFVTPLSGWSPHEITAVLTLSGKTFEATATPSSASTDSNLESTINFDLPEGAIEKDATYSVELRDPTAKPGPGGARHPASGTEALSPRDTGGQLKIMIVPVKTGGGVGDTSAAQLELYRKEALANYPARKVEITVHEPYSFSSSIDGSGAGFDVLLHELVQLRMHDKAPPDVYYYGGFANTSSFSTYCKGGCVTGLCGLSDDPSNSSVRACAGIGFTGGVSAETMVHEVGHAHGRRHAPCGGVAGADPDFPHGNGRIGTWGWDIVNHALVTSDHADFMSYCNPVWVSDYTFQALLERMAFVSGSKSIVGSEEKPLRVARVLGDGTIASVGDSITASTPLADHVISIDGKAAPAKFVRYDHLPGGLLIFPDGGSGATVVAKDLVPGATGRITLH